jgi:hypothetical protein
MAHVLVDINERCYNCGVVEFTLSWTKISLMTHMPENNEREKNYGREFQDGWPVSRMTPSGISNCEK